MRAWDWTIGTLGLVAACGGAMDPIDTVAIGGAGAPNGGAPGTGGSRGEGGEIGAPDGGGGEGGSYVDPGCPPPKTVQGIFECDAATQTGCAPGDRCVPVIRYADACGSEEVGTACALAGTARQGDDCAFDECAAGFVCVSGGTGLICARLCQTDGFRDDCPPGLVCSALDVDGFSVCG